ncbi:MAG: hypothetical protein ACI4DR_03395 [Roseburia sp.]
MGLFGGLRLLVKIVMIALRGDTNPEMQGVKPQPGQQPRQQSAYHERWKNRQTSMEAAIAERQQELKERMKRGSQGSNNRRQSAKQPGDILSRAAANVMQNERDALKQELAGVQPMASEKWMGDLLSIDAGDTMRELQNLMVMGYQPRLSNERDFVAESLALLQRYETLDGI